MKRKSISELIAVVAICCFVTALNPSASATELISDSPTDIRILSNSEAESISGSGIVCLTKCDSSTLSPCPVTTPGACSPPSCAGLGKFCSLASTYWTCFGLGIYCDDAGGAPSCGNEYDRTCWIPAHSPTPATICGQMDLIVGACPTRDCKL